MVFLHSHGVRHRASGADFQDLRRRRHPGHDREPPIGWPEISAVSASRPPTPLP
jgi:hypothetical protein